MTAVSGVSSDGPLDMFFLGLARGASLAISITQEVDALMLWSCPGLCVVAITAQHNNNNNNRNIIINNNK